MGLAVIENGSKQKKVLWCVKMIHETELIHHSPPKWIGSSSRYHQQDRSLYQE